MILWHRMNLVKVSLSGDEYDRLPAESRKILNSWRVAVRTDGLTFLLPQKELRKANALVKGEQ